MDTKANKQRPAASHQQLLIFLLSTFTAFFKWQKTGSVLTTVSQRMYKQEAPHSRFLCYQKTLGTLDFSKGGLSTPSPNAGGFAEWVSNRLWRTNCTTESFILFPCLGPFISKGKYFLKMPYETLLKLSASMVLVWCPQHSCAMHSNCYYLTELQVCISYSFSSKNKNFKSNFNV